MTPEVSPASSTTLSPDVVSVLKGGVGAALTLQPKVEEIRAWLTILDDAGEDWQAIYEEQVERRAAAHAHWPPAPPVEAVAPGSSGQTIQESLETPSTSQPSDSLEETSPVELPLSEPPTTSPELTSSSGTSAPEELADNEPLPPS